MKPFKSLQVPGPYPRSRILQEETGGLEVVVIKSENTGWSLWASVSLLEMRSWSRLVFSRRIHQVDSSRKALCGSVFAQCYLWRLLPLKKKFREPLRWWSPKFSYNSSECHILSGLLSHLLGGGFSRSHTKGSYTLFKGRAHAALAGSVHSCDVVQFDLYPFLLPNCSVASLPTSLEAPRAFLPFYHYFQ